jgi:hypothetical protein
MTVGSMKIVDWADGLKWMSFSIFNDFWNCAHVGNIELVMPQKRTDYSKFTQSSGTVQVLMLWASLALHFLVGSNLGLFGRLDPIKVKPVGGTVRVVDLTPSEQTRVPEAAKSKPLPIAPIPVNPETATRTLANSTNVGRSGASDFAPPRANRPPLPRPSGQVLSTPSNQTPAQSPQRPFPPNPPTNNKDNRVDTPIIKPPKVSQDNPDGQSDKNDGNGQRGNNKKRLNSDSSPDTSTTEEKIGSSGKKQTTTPLKTTPDIVESPFQNSIDNNTSEKSRAQIIDNFRKFNLNVDIRRPVTRISQKYPTGEICRTSKIFNVVTILRDYEDPTDKDPNGNPRLKEGQEEGTAVDPKNTLGAVAANQGQEDAKKQHANRPVSQKVTERGKYISYEFEIKFGIC